MQDCIKLLAFGKYGSVIFIKPVGTTKFLRHEVAQSFVELCGVVPWWSNNIHKTNLNHILSRT